MPSLRSSLTTSDRLTAPRARLVLALASLGLLACVSTPQDDSPCSRHADGGATNCATAGNFERRRIPPPASPTQTSAKVPLKTTAPSTLETQPQDGPTRTTRDGAPATTRLPSNTLDRRPPWLVVKRLLHHVSETTFSPPLPEVPATRCGRRLLRAAAPNPFSKVEGPLARRHHQRVPLLENLRLTDIRDALTVEAPRRLTFPNLQGPAGATLRFAYAVSRCPSWERRTISMLVTVRRPGQPPWRHTVMLRRPTPGWTEMEIRLPTADAERFDLELALQADGDKPFPVSLAQLYLMGRVHPTAVKPERRARNVILVVIDALRADLIGPSRRKDLPSLAPNIEAFLARGTYFKRAYSVSNQTRHSTLAMLSSQPPTMGGFFATTWNVAGPARDAYYARDPPLLSRILSAAGWNTDTVGHNRFLFAHHPMGMDHGFDRIWNDGRRGVKDTPALVNRGIARLANVRNDRFFHYFNLVTPHVPYKTPPGYLEQVQRMVPPGIDGYPSDLPPEYLAEIRYLDDEFGRLLRAFEQLGLADDTVVAVTADHGELFSRHHACRSNKQKAWCQNNHGLTLYNEELHVPLGFVGPDIPAGQVIDTPTSLIDLAPSLLEAAGLNPSPRHAGLSLLPLIQGRPDAPAPSPVYAESKRMVALVQDNLKLIVHHLSSDVRTSARIGAPPTVPKVARLAQQQGRRDGTYTGPRPAKIGKTERRALAKAAGRYELYDLAKDPDETRNLARAELSAETRPDGSRDRVSALVKRLAAVRQRFATRVARAVATVTPPTAAVPSRVATPVSTAYNVLLVRGGTSMGELTGTLHTADADAQLSCGTVRGAASCTTGPRGELRIRLSAEGGLAGIAFRSSPWNAALTFDLRLDGAPIARSDLRLGPFGIGFPGDLTSRTLDLATLRFAQASYPPRLSRHGAPGLFFWRDIEPHPPVSPAAPEVVGPQTREPAAAAAPSVPIGPEAIDQPTGAEPMSPEMQKILRELGYSR